MARMSRAVRPPWTEMRRNTDDRETVYVSVAAADRRSGAPVLEFFLRRRLSAPQLHDDAKMLLQ